MGKLLAELKRRNVLRIAGLYLVGAWLLLQVANVVFPVFDAPRWVLQALIVVLSVGLIPAVALAWSFELTPAGLKRESELSPGEAMAPGTARRIDRMIVAGLCLVIALLLAERFWPRGENPSASTGPGFPSLGDRSIAVLPFVNISQDAAQDYFSDGITEELLGSLARLSDIKVVGRTSSFAFKGKDQDLRAIGKTLGVRHILEGSVRQQGDRVRISAKLILADDGTQLWSDTYDRDMDDIFAVQDEITAAIVGALKSELGASELKATPSLPIEAYSLYLQARQKLALRNVESLAEAPGLLARVIALAPDYAPAHSGLGLAIYLQETYSRAVGSQTSLSRATEASKRAAREALRLDPLNAEAHSVLGTIALTVERDWVTAGLEIARSLELAPSDAEIVNFAGDYYRQTLHPNALATERLAIALNPTQAVNHHDLGLASLALRDFAGAAAAFSTADALGFYEPMPELLVAKLLPLLELKRFDEAKELASRIELARGPGAPYAQLARAGIAFAEGDSAAIARLLPSLETLALRGEIPPSEMVWKLILAGRMEDAALWLERAREAGDFQIFEPYPFALPEDLPDHPAIQAALAKLQLGELFALRRANLQAAAASQ